MTKQETARHLATAKAAISKVEARAKLVEFYLSKLATR